jgi:hypothetical protein
MRPQPPLLAGVSVRRPSASCPGEWQEALSLPHPRAEHPLVAQTLSPDLLICAKDLFVEATEQQRHIATSAQRGQSPALVHPSARASSSEQNHFPSNLNLVPSTVSVSPSETMGAAAQTGLVKIKTKLAIQPRMKTPNVADPIHL